MRWLLSSWGSAGDLHPFLALARGLRARGHTVLLTGPVTWSETAQEAEIPFLAICRGATPGFLRAHPEIFSRRFKGLESLDSLLRKALAPGLDEAYSALFKIAPEFDVMVAHHFAFAAAAVAEARQMPWATISLAPGAVPSHTGFPGADYTPLGDGPLYRVRCRLQWLVGRHLIRLSTDPLINAFRLRHGLPAVRGAVLEALSPRLNLQLYSELFAPASPEWRLPIRYGGFCLYEPPGAVLDKAVATFLDAGPPPILFTLGTAAVHVAGDFYKHAGRICRELGRRGLLLYGPPENRPDYISEEVLAVPYAPLAQVVTRVAVAVHQGGVGTLAQVLRAGVPAVICPFAFDQPNNARRLEHLGVGRMVPPGRRRLAQLSVALEEVRRDGAMAQRAAALGARLRIEDGVARSCAVLEEVFS